MDFQCLKEFSWIFSKCGELILGMMGTDRSLSNCLPNAMMASAPSEGFWLGYLANIEIAWKTTNIDLKFSPENIGLDNIKPVKITGPGILYKTADQYSTDLTKFKKIVFQFIDRHELAIGPDE